MDKQATPYSTYSMCHCQRLYPAVIIKRFFYGVHYFTMQERNVKPKK